MASPYRFVQDCPTCGRKLRIQLELLGRQVACQHCRATFVALNPEGTGSVDDSTDPLLDRVDAAMKKAQAFVKTSEPVNS